MTHPMMGSEPNVCCQRGGAGRKAFSWGMKTAGLTFAPLRRSVARRDVGASWAEVVMVWVCNWRGCAMGAGARSRGPSSMGKEPLGKRGMVVDRGRRFGAWDVVAVAEDAVADVSGIVLDEVVCGDERRETAPPTWAWRARSPP